MFKPLLAAVVVFPLLLTSRVPEPDYQAANVRISSDYRADKAACASLPATQRRDVCYELARARRQVTRAELEHGNGGHAGDRHKVLQARAEAAYAVARVKCGGVEGDVQGVLERSCLRHARTVEAQALADAGRMPPAGAAQPNGVRVQRALVGPLKPVAAAYKAKSL